MNEREKQKYFRILSRIAGALEDIARTIEVNKSQE
jgi:DNA-binding FrmR family transcriptional regulator